MTVCIVAVCGYSNWTVQATDHLATFVGGGLSLTADSILFKANSIDHFWNAMMAGDLARGHTIIDSIRSHSGNWNQKRSYEQVVETIAGAYQAAVRQEITNRVLSVYGLTMEDFVRDGLKIFGSEAFADIRYRIERAQSDFDCELLISGFEGVSQPRVFCVVNPGDAVNHDDLHFWAIGSGAAIALGSLANRGQQQFMTVLETIYNVLEAKFAAERSPGVGRETWVSLDSPDYPGDPPFIHDDVIKQVKKAWEKENLKRKAPQRALDVIKEAIGSDTNPPKSSRSDSE